MRPRSILVVCTRRLGDVLLSTALVRSLKSAWPESAIDVAVLQGSAAVLEGNADIRRVIVMPPQGGVRAVLSAVGPFHAYDLALATFTDDRAQFIAFWAGRRRANIVPRPGAGGSTWKRWLSHEHVISETPWVHMGEQFLRLADVLGIPRAPYVVPPKPADTRALDRLLGPGWRDRPYAVVHAVPLYRYKAWTQDGWSRLIAWLHGQGLRVVLSGGPDPAERRFVGALAQAGQGATVDVSGQLRFAELTPLIAGARVYVGPDTSVTHLAAATGTPTVALFGPTPPENWGPWPQGYAGGGRSPWLNRAPLQRQGTVSIVQGLPECVPCGAEGCERHLASRSDCLDQLPPSRVIAAVAQSLRR